MHDERTKHDLATLADDHLAKARVDAHGRSAEVVLHDGFLRQTVIAIASGCALDEHNAPPAASVQVLRGRVRITAGEASQDLGIGQLSGVPKVRHGLLALEDAVVLLTAVNP